MADFENYAKSIDLRTLLGLPKSFNCVFHDDRTQSACISRGKKTGDSLYCCHSSNCGDGTLSNSTYNLFTFIHAITGRDYPEIREFLKLVLNCTVEDNGPVEESGPSAKPVSEMITFNTEMLRSHKNLLAIKVAGTSLQILFTLYAVAKEAALSGHGVRTKDGVHMSISATYIEKALQKLNLPGGTHSMKIAQCLAVLTYLGLIGKEPIDSLSARQLSSVGKLSRTSKEGVKLINQLFLFELKESRLEQIEKRAALWKSNGYKKENFSFDEILSKESIFEAMRIYPQGCKSRPR
jgi:hypothetical protein